MSASPVRIGTAGWGIPSALAMEFPGAGPLLARYARRFNAVEINTTFYRTPKPETFCKWASLVPEGFRFAVKAPRTLTHFHRLGPGADLEGFLEHAAHLGPRLGPILIQLPPGFPFQAGVLGAFLARLRGLFQGQVALEPRHPSWFCRETEGLLRDFQVARVAADPHVTEAAGRPGGWDGLIYFRWHGSPVMYFSSYDRDTLRQQAAALKGLQAPAWCVLDNTGSGEAAANALFLASLLAEGDGRQSPGSG